jgi:hypothetical protein
MCQCSKCAMCAHGSGSAIKQGQAAPQNCREHGRDGEAMALGNRDKPMCVMARRTAAAPQREAGRAAAVAAARQRGGAAARRPAAARPQPGHIQAVYGLGRPTVAARVRPNMATSHSRARWPRTPGQTTQGDVHARILKHLPKLNRFD